MNKAPAYQVYANEEFTKAGSLTNAELGALTRARNWSWIHGALPCNDDRRRRIMQVDAEDWPATWAVVRESLAESAHGWTFPELEDQRARHAAYREKQVKNGRASGEARRKNHGSTTVQPKTNHGSTTVQPKTNHGSTMAPTRDEPETNSSIFNFRSSICRAEERTYPSAPTPRKRRAARVLASADFERFYVEYPRKMKREQALKAWEDLAPNEALQARMLDALSRQCRQPGWLEDGGKYIPYPASWLNGRRWEDEPFHLRVEADKAVEDHNRLGGWKEECQREHGGACGNQQHFHVAKMAHDR